MFQIYDLNNWLRIQIESDMTGQVLRNMWVGINTSPLPQLWVADGANGNERRRRLYPDYKKTRKSAGESIYKTFDLFKKLLRHGPATCWFCEVPGYEADDTIAALVDQLKIPQYYLFSTDRDLSQLPGAILTYTPKVPCGEIRLFKTMVGDPSDNLKGIPGFGKGKWAQLTAFDKTAIMLSLETQVALPSPYNKWEKELRLGWELTGFMKPSPIALTSNLSPGDGNHAAGEALLQEWLL